MAASLLGLSEALIRARRQGEQAERAPGPPAGGQGAAIRAEGWRP